MRVIILTSLLTGGFFFSVCRRSEAATLPLHDWSRDAFERLTAAGLVDISLVFSGPVERFRAAEEILDVVRRIRSGEVRDVPGSEDIENLILRLTDELNPELQIIAPDMYGSGGKARGPRKYFLGLESGGDYGIFSREQAYSIPNGQGRNLYEEQNARIALAGRFSPAKYFNLDLMPVFYYSGEDADIILQQGSMGVNCGNIDFSFGRLPLWYGPGYHGTLLLSDNSRSPVSAELKSRKPFSLPYFFRYLGKLNGRIFLSRLEEDRDHSRPYLTGTRAEWLPFTFLGLGVNHTALFGGKELGGFSASLWGKALIARNAGKITDLNDHLTSFDFQFVLPRSLAKYLPLSRGLKIYGELGAEDNLPGFMDFRDFGYVGGVYIPGIFRMKGMDCRFEFAQTDFDWYEHSTYSSGYTYYGDVIGHHMGKDSKDYFLELSKRFSEYVTAKLIFDREERLRSTGSKETRDEVRIKFSGRIRESVEFSCGYSFIRIDNSADLGGEDDKLHFISLRSSYRF